MLLFMLLLTWHGVACELEYTYEFNPDEIVSDPDFFTNTTVNLGGEEIRFRVVKGTAAAKGDVPYQVALMGRRSFRSPYSAFCGGTIIGPKKVLTAAHCIESNTLSFCFRGTVRRNAFKNKMVAAGILQTRSYSHPDSSGEQWRQIRIGHYPSRYRFPSQDIAALGLTKPFYYNAYVSPVPYARKYVDYGAIGLTCRVSGYGRVDNYNQSPILLKAVVAILTNRRCRQIHGKKMDKFVCTSDTVADVHKGDSGGPLLCSGTRDPAESRAGLVVGVVSGKLIGKPLTTFFTRVSAYPKFIDRSASDPVSRMSLFLGVITLLVHSTYVLF